MPVLASRPAPDWLPIGRVRLSGAGSPADFVLRKPCITCQE